MEFCKIKIYANSHILHIYGVSETKEAKNRELNSLEEAYKDLPIQGSPKWLYNRGYIIGGSEMNTIIGHNPYSSLKAWVASKININPPFDGNLFTRWGKLFEIITTSLTEVMLNMDGEIKEFGSIPCCTRSGISYSPDGIGIVELDCIKDNNKINKENLMVLFEFKSPFSTIPMGIIPNQYVSQGLTGMCSIPNIDITLFINNLYRKCSLDQFQYTNEYDTAFHYGDKTKKYKAGNPISLGMIYFYMTDDQMAKYMSEQGLNIESDASDNDQNSDIDIDMDMDMNMNNISQRQYKTLADKILTCIQDGEPMDLGISNRSGLDEILVLLEKDVISVHYDAPYIIKSELGQIPFLTSQGLSYMNLNSDRNSQNKIIHNIKNIKTKFERLCKKQTEKNKRQKKFNKSIIGVLPWKLFKCDIIPQEKNIDFLNQNKEHIDKALGILEQINQGDPDISTKRERYNKIFGISKPASEEFKVPDSFYHFD